MKEKVEKIKNNEFLKKNKTKIIFIAGCVISYLIGKKRGKCEAYHLTSCMICDAMNEMPEDSAKLFRESFNKIAE